MILWAGVGNRDYLKMGHGQINAIFYPTVMGAAARTHRHRRRPPSPTGHRRPPLIALTGDAPRVTLSV